MALLTDSFIVSTEDLRAYETSVLDTAAGEGIDLSQKVKVSHNEVTSDIYRLLVELTATREMPPSVRLDQIVITEPLRLWIILHTLTLIYRDAYHNALNDRFQAKWREYERQSGLAKERYFDSGLGVARSPLSKVGHVVVCATPGVMASGTYQIRTTWVNAAQQESAPSDSILFLSEGGAVPRVKVSGSPDGATGWNIYASALDSIPLLQNAEPNPLSEEWVAIPSGFVAGKAVADGQAPDYFLRRVRMI